MSKYSKRIKNPARFWLDIETAGLQTPSYLWGVKPGASEYGPAISEFAFGGDNRRTRVRGYTDLVHRGMLDKHGLTLESLKSGGALPSSLVQELLQGGPKRWDPSVAEKGVLGGVFRTHARHALRNRPTQNLTSFVNQMLGHLDKELGKGGPVELLGWNITGFDIPTIHGQLRQLAEQTGDTALLKRFEGTMSKVKIKEASEAYQRLVYKRMLQTSFSPVISDRAVMNAAAERGQVAFQTVQEAMRSGALRENNVLRGFMDDVKAHVSGNRSVFSKKVERWATRYVGTAEAKLVGEAVGRQMSGIGTDHRSFQGVARRIVGSRGRALGVGGFNTSAFDIINAVWADEAHPHMQIFSAPAIGGIGYHSPVTAFNFAGAGRQADVAQSFIQAANDTGFNSSMVKRLERRLKHGHVAESDRQTMKMLYNLMERAPDRTMERMSDIHLDIGNVQRLGLARVNETMRDLVREQSERTATAAVARGAEHEALAQVASKAGSKASVAAQAAIEKPDLAKLGGLRGPARMKALLLAAGLVFMSERNKDSEQIQGLRTPNSMNNLLDGISPSEMDGANTSFFFSGYHSWELMQGSASFLGKTWTSPYGQSRKRSTNQTATQIAEGNMLHALTEQDLAGVSYASEFQLYGAGMEGRTDVMLKGGIPMEIKTLADDAALSMLKQPRRGDVGQANYDAVATGSPYSYIMYVSRENPTKRRIFRQYADPTLLASQQALMTGQIAQDGGVPSFAFGSFLRQRMGNLVMQTLYNLGLYGSAPKYQGEDPFAEVPGGDYVPIFRPEAFGGYTQNLSENAQRSKIRDQATQLGGMPGLPRTRRGRLAHNGYGHSEMAALE